jgi:L-asparaginase
MIPYVFNNSDALFNLGAAVTAVQLLGEGVFIVMNGKVFNWDNVKKNFDIGEFQKI